MDHDSIPSGVTPPASHKISDLRKSYTEFARHGLAVMGERIANESDYTSNEGGHFAWDVSLLIRAACLTRRVTGDNAHLEQAAVWAKHIVDHSDKAQNITDWRGRSRPVWSAGSRYNAGTAAVGNIGNMPIHLQASSERVIVERPSETTAIIRAVRADGHTWSSPEASLLPEDDDYLPDILSRQSIYSVLIRGLITPGKLTSLTAGSYQVEPQFASHLVHTGMIARSLIAAGEELSGVGPGVIKSDVTPEELFTAATQALFAHDDEIRFRTGTAWYITPDDFPGRRLGLELPHNHIVDAATSFLILGRRPNADGLRHLGSSLANRFLGEVKQYENGRLRHPWSYYPTGSDSFAGVTRETPITERIVRAIPRGEDSSHATMRARALAEWKAIDETLVPDSAMSAVADAFRRFYFARRDGVANLRWLPADKVDSPRFGYTNTYPGAWGGLAPWSRGIRRLVNSLAYQHPPQAFFGATILSAAEILAMNAGVPTYASARSAYS